MSYLTLPDGNKMDVFGAGGGEILADAAGVPFIGAIPMDPQVRHSGDMGTPVIISHPDSEASKAILSIAESIAARVSVLAKGSSSIIPIEMID
jgi:ATP-binding protein involved in chromosome partitioning